MTTSASFKIDSLKKEELERILLEEGFTFIPTQYAHFRATNREITITLYNNYNLLIQGKDIHLFIDKLYDSKILTFTESKPYSKWLGSDEAGKGDYFGPLVVAACLVDNNKQELLFKIGVKDSKQLSPHTIDELATKIKNICRYSIVSINPTRYNELYEKIKNQNKLLAWQHIKAIENILKEEGDCECAVIDKFAAKNLLNYTSIAQKIKLEQLEHAEGKDIAVAAASILAKHAFMRKLDILSKVYKINLIKGATDEVIPIAKEFVKKYDKDRLKEVAKLHFKTTKLI